MNYAELLLPHRNRLVTVLVTTVTYNQYRRIGLPVLDGALISDDRELEEQMLTKLELINKIMKLENKSTLQAVEELRVRGWLTDGALRGVALCQAQMQNADLMGADLRNVDFHQATLDFADLCKARLNGVKLNRASLQRVNFDHADLTYADLYKANLRGARNLTAQQLSSVRQLLGVIMPDGTVYDGRFNLPGDLARASWAKVNLDDKESMAEFYGVSLEAYLRGHTQVTIPSV
jgi:uncharacterized protein YjbI with pentapeptide repeats